jgi:ubiquinone/menaquinone biosynthesis C-methylase UbiE
METMKRLAEKDINTPEWFNHVWAVEGIHNYDATRLREFIKEARDGLRILDVGAGWMGFAQYAVANGYPGQYTALDFSEIARERTLLSLGNRASRLYYQIGNALALPFGDGAFDIVGCGELIEHFHEPQLLVDELARVTKPGGRLVISTLDANCEAAKAHGCYPEHLVQWDAPEELLPMFELFGPSRAWVLGHYYMVSCEVKRNRRGV